MLHTWPNFQTKEALEKAFEAEKQIVIIDPQDNNFKMDTDGEFLVRGPWFYVTWYARVTLNNGKIIEIK